MGALEAPYFKLADSLSHAVDDLSANALGEPQGLRTLRRSQDTEELWQQLAGLARHQRKLRAMIPPGGLRALYLDHLHALAEDTGARLILYHPKGFIAQWAAQVNLILTPPEITTPLPLTRKHYLIGLHEFGHVYQPDLGGTNNRGVTAEGIYGELMAHVWAFEHSKVPITKGDLDHAKISLYLDAKEIGWSGGPVADLADLLPASLRKPYADGLALGPVPQRDGR